MKNTYLYGMRYRGFSPWRQPKEGLVERRDDPTGRYHDLLVYDRKLTKGELHFFELDYLGNPGVLKENKP